MIFIKLLLVRAKFMQKTVLIVEDFEDARDLMRLLIERQGYNVVEAAGAYEAIEKAERYEPHLILIDIGLPLLDGLSVARMIHQIDGLKDTPIVAVTAYRDILDQAEAAGCAGVLYKPVLENELENLLDEFLGEGRGSIRTVF